MVWSEFGVAHARMPPANPDAATRPRVAVPAPLRKSLRLVYSIILLIPPALCLLSARHDTIPG